jgi:hypothetical protein
MNFLFSVFSTAGALRFQGMQLVIMLCAVTTIINKIVIQVKYERVKERISIADTATLQNIN